MAAARRPLGGGSWFAAAILAVALVGLPAPAGAVPDWVKKAFTLGLRGDGRVSAPVTGRYTSDGGTSFVLDRSSGRTLLKFEDSPEVWALFATRGPRGDILYTDDIGELLLRATRLGGMTVFTASRPEGSAVVLLGPCPALRLPALGWVRFTQRIVQASARASRAAQHAVYFDGPGSAPNSKAPTADITNDGLIADAAAVAADAVIVLAARTSGRGVSASLNTVALDIGSHANVIYRAGVVRITLVPSQGYAGRPSSHRILRALGAR